MDEEREQQIRVAIAGWVKYDQQEDEARRLKRQYRNWAIQLLRDSFAEDMEMRGWPYDFKEMVAYQAETGDVG